MAKPLHLVGKIRTNLRISQCHAGRRDVSPRTLHTVDSPTAIKSPQTPVTAFTSKLKDSARRVLWGSSSPTHVVAAAGAAKTATDIPSPTSAANLSDAASPPANVLEEIARNLPQSSLYNSYKYDVTGDAPYPLWFLDPNGAVYPHVMSIARNASTILESFHDFTGAPWWLTVVLGGVAVRIAVLPFTIYSLRNASRAADAKDDITAITRAFNKAVSRVGKGNAAEKFRLMMIAKKGIVAALEKAHCYPWRSLAMPLLQIPIVISGVLGARHSILTGNEAFEREGALWFSDLTVHDPYYVLPIVSMGLTYATLEIIFGKSRGSKTGAAGLLGSGLGNTVKSGFQMSLILSAPFLTELPAGVYLLMMTNSVWTIGYLAAVRSPSVYKALTGRDLPAANNPSTSSTPSPVANVASTSDVDKPAAAANLPTPTPSLVSPISASNVHVERSVLNTSHFVVPAASIASTSSASSTSTAGMSQRMAMHTQTVVHTTPVSTPPAVEAQAAGAVAPTPTLAFPQFVTVKATNLEEATAEIAGQFNEAMQGMNSQWPLLSGTANPFVLRIAAGTARAPWYIPPSAPVTATGDNSKKASASNAMAQQIVQAVKSALAEHDTPAPTSTSKIAPKHLAMSSYVPEADAHRPIGARARLSFEGYRRVYLGDIGNMPYGVTGPTPWQLDIIKGPGDSTETIPGLLDMTLAGRHKRDTAQAAANNGNNCVFGGRGFSSTSGGGVGGNGDGNNNNGKKDDAPPVDAIPTKRTPANDAVDPQGYAASSSSGLSTDSESALSSDDDAGRAAIPGRRRRRRAGNDKRRKQARKALINSLLVKADATPGLPKVSRRSSRRWARILHLAAVKVRPSAKDKLLQRTQDAQSVEASVTGKETAPPVEEEVLHHISPVPHSKSARKTSQEILGYDVSSELTKLAFTQAPHEDNSSAAKQDSASTVDDDTMRAILGEHFDSWVKQEIEAGRRSRLPAVIEAEDHMVIPAAFDLEHPSENPIVEVVKEERKTPVKTKARMAGTVLEDGTFIADDEHPSAGAPSKKLDLAGLLRETDHRNVGKHLRSSNTVAASAAEEKAKHQAEMKRVVAAPKVESAKPFNPNVLDIPQTSEDVTAQFAELDAVSNFQVDFGYAREISPGSAAVPSEHNEESEDTADGKDEHQRRLEKLKSAAGHFLDKSRHAVSQTGRRRRGHPPHLHSTLTFERNKNTRQVGAVSKLVFAGLAPTAVPFPLEVGAAEKPSEDIEDLLSRIQVAIEGAGGASRDSISMRNAPPGVLAGDASAEAPVYDPAGADKRTHKPSNTFPFGNKGNDQGGNNESD